MKIMATNTRLLTRLRPALLAIVLLLAGCQRPPQAAEVVVLPLATAAGRQATATPQPNASVTTAPTPLLIATATATSTPTAPATVTPSRTPAATPTLTPTPTITPTPLHPLSIEAMRQRSYPGSDLVFEETLAPGAGHERFVVSYQSEGNKIYALLTVPNGETPAGGWPVIVFNHGYIPPSQYRTTERYEAHVDDLARHGYIVLRPDYRGHGRSEGVARGGYGTPDYTVDVLNAVGSIKRFAAADPARIGMWGHSMGGQITLRAMVVSEEIQAGVIWAGVVASYEELAQRWRRPGPTRTPDPARPERSWRARLVETYGSPAENPAFWASISPNAYLADLSGPLQLHHGTADEIVPYEFSETLREQMRAELRLVELHLYEGDDHNLNEGYGLAMLRSIRFFDSYVKGRE